ncbi:MAG: class I SAM-dependent methyltransferase [candidate division Zixibacteria bacterium]|nr:class I SAM-dependent methyltransferase [candidate division Zixibacteria bacterium]
MPDPKKTVKEAYNKVSYVYREDSLEPKSEDFLKYKSWTDELSYLVPEKSSILELGCGCGIPVTKLLSEKYKVTGVDFSDVQIGRAKQLVPDADFICNDICEQEFSEESFNAIVCLYTIIHIPLDEHQKLLNNMFRWLKSEGYLLIIVGYDEWTGTEANWLGVEGGDMFWDHADKDTYISWLKDIGFKIQREEFIPEEDSGHTLILASKV